MSDYEKARALGRTQINRWASGTGHHPQSVRLMEFLKQHDFNDYGDYFCWKTGGDGDNGESLMYEMDAYFETVEPESELRAVLSALGAEKGPEGWTKPCRGCEACGASIGPDNSNYCHGTGRIPVPPAAPLTGKEEPR